MDPTLELQRLASEAINYQQQLNQHPHPADQPLTHYPSTDTPSDTKFPCPFPSCGREYKRKDLLKRHLTTLLASPDENHRNQEIWDHVRDSGVMTVYTRPRNLTGEQKKQRRKESNLRHRVKYAAELKDKRNRKRRVEKLLEGKTVGVQTPDWEAEARKHALEAAAAIHMQATHANPPVYVDEVQPRAGRRARVKQ
jgi:hypothetical protein